jgi:hypothetical protein
MSLHLFVSPTPAALHTLAAYENGSVVLRRCSVAFSASPETFVDGMGWEKVWSFKMHVESGPPFLFCSSFAHDGISVMATALSRDNTFALSVSADHLIGRYDLTVSFHRSSAFPQ